MTSILWKGENIKLLLAWPSVYNPALMLFRSAERLKLIERRASEISARIQRLEDEQSALKAWFESERRLRLLAANIAAAAQAAPSIGLAIENFAKALRAPLARGRLGGLARAGSAWRYRDGTFMPESEKQEVYLSEYERHAAGGRARAASAKRNAAGMFTV